MFYGMPFAVIYVFLPMPISYPCYYMLTTICLPNTLHIYPRESLMWILPFKIFYIPEFMVNQVSSLAIKDK